MERTPPWHGKPQIRRRPGGLPESRPSIERRLRGGEKKFTMNLWECLGYGRHMGGMQMGIHDRTWYDMISFFGDFVWFSIKHDDNRAKKRSRPRVGTWIHRSKTFNQLVAFKDVNTNTVGIFFWGTSRVFEASSGLGAFRLQMIVTTIVFFFGDSSQISSLGQF